VFGTANASVAAPPTKIPTPPINISVDDPLPPGTACDFRLSIVSNGDRVDKIFVDKNGERVRLIQAGRGWELTFTNADTHSALTLKPNGSVYQEKTNPDGSLTVTATGHNVIIFFPSDVPAGPSTIQYVGRIVYTVLYPGTANQVFTLQQVSGKQVDICAALSN
jgi:hypothetical protein